MRRCPFCAEEIQDAAIVCRFCQRDLAPAVAAVPPTNPRSTRWAVGLIVGLLVLTGVGIILSPSRPPPPPTLPYSAESAVGICRQFVERRLKAPASAKFPDASDATTTDLGDGKFRVLTYVDSQNGFGALIRNTVDCTVHWTDGTNWSLDDLTLKGR